MARAGRRRARIVNDPAEGRLLIAAVILGCISLLVAAEAVA